MGPNEFWAGKRRSRFPPRIRWGPFKKVYNSEYAVLCSLLRGSTDFFFWRYMGRRWAITTLNFKEVSYESGNLHNHSSDNLEPLNLKKSAMEVLFCTIIVVIT